MNIKQILLSALCASLCSAQAFAADMNLGNIFDRTSEILVTDKGEGFQLTPERNVTLSVSGIKVAPKAFTYKEVVYTFNAEIYLTVTSTNGKRAGTKYLGTTPEFYLTAQAGEYVTQSATDIAKATVPMQKIYDKLEGMERQDTISLSVKVYKCYDFRDRFTGRVTHPCYSISDKLTDLSQVKITAENEFKDREDALTSMSKTVEDQGLQNHLENLLAKIEGKKALEAKAQVVLNQANDNASNLVVTAKAEAAEMLAKAKKELEDKQALIVAAQKIVNEENTKKLAEVKANMEKQAQYNAQVGLLVTKVGSALYQHQQDYSKRNQIYDVRFEMADATIKRVNERVTVTQNPKGFWSKLWNWDWTPYGKDNQWAKTYTDTPSVRSNTVEFKTTDMGSNITDSIKLLSVPAENTNVLELPNFEWKSFGETGATTGNLLVIPATNK
jgi:hypothetical protein